MLDKVKSITLQIPRFGKVVIPLAAIFLIGFLMPRETRFPYEFEEGEVWRYGDMIAPFDYSLYKSEESILTEKERILEGFSPYFMIDNQVQYRMQTAFSEGFDRQMQEEKSNPAYSDVVFQQRAYKSVGKGLLLAIYHAGMIGQDSILNGKDNSFVINVIDGNATFKRTLGNLYNARTAYEFITDSLPHTRIRNPEFLLPLLEKGLLPNLIYNDSLTQKYQNQELSSLSKTVGSIKAGDLILANNTRISAADFQKLSSLKKHYESGQEGQYTDLFMMLGNFALIGLILLILYVYLRKYNEDNYNRFGDLLLIFLWPVFFGLLSIFVVKNASISPYFIPFAIVPLVTKSFFPIRLTMALHLVVVILSTLILGLGFDFLMMQLLVGVVALIVSQETRYWGHFFGTIGLIILTYVVLLFLLSFVKNGAVASVDFKWISWLMLNGLLLLIAYPLIPLFGKLFGKLTGIQLAELSDFNHPLLKDLSVKAPGTFQHSLQVANLAEAAADSIGANALLVKVAALFHDIGKMNNPMYFIENQKGKNAHDTISSSESAKIIIDHVADGIKLGKKHSLPKEIISMIWSHHGTSRVEYFYRTEMKEKGESAVNPKDFTYPGPRPKTKEEVILMIADSLEAASHSLKEPNEKNLDELIKKVIANKKSTNQFDESEMTFLEFETIIDTIRRRLHSIHHIRVAYPD